ncbi:hypothetical protein CXG81DRAFT_26300 [Caulochytrium protostelioides]|uniref:Cleavage and polyadenylation specificity factor subunit 2 n=1 Tax=Caulochytrium protostelioides TaxID=1555241 RepID=A0A4P9X701_9FUNG|nr:hypothetical protein CXG81DRAFT_26300 [Caulochytrium protostelioides]|eukprot:RKP00996.1 hypothetical protein CXG81DRAFT_26300 [Caulochytrium protostelioides]
MASIQFTPLYGDAYHDGPMCYLVQVDEAAILLDCGWSAACDPQQLAPLARIAARVDAVLLSHATLTHLGALPYAVHQLGLACPVYATTPVHDLGRVCLRDLYASRQHDDGAPPPFTLAHIDQALGHVTRLRYSQPCPLAGRGHGITVTPYPAGHTLGGSVWRIEKDGEVIVYAVDYNHRRELHLDGTALLAIASAQGSGVSADATTATAAAAAAAAATGSGGLKVVDTDLGAAFHHPSVFITDSRAVHRMMVPGPGTPESRRATQLQRLLRYCAAKPCNALIPTDASARVLELALALNQAYAALYGGNAAHRRGAHGPGGALGHSAAAARRRPTIVFLAHQSTRTFDLARTMLEWMSKAMVAQSTSGADPSKSGNHHRGGGQGSRGQRGGAGGIPGGVFDLRHIRSIQTLAELESIPQPYVVLASLPDLEMGFSRQLMLRWASDPANLVVLTEIAAQGTLSRHLYSIWQRAFPDPQSAVPLEEDVEAGDGEAAVAGRPPPPPLPPMAMTWEAQDAPAAPYVAPAPLPPLPIAYDAARDDADSDSDGNDDGNDGGKRLPRWHIRGVTRVPLTGAALEQARAQRLEHAEAARQLMAVRMTRREAEDADADTLAAAAGGAAAGAAAGPGPGGVGADDRLGGDTGGDAGDRGSRAAPRSTRATRIGGLDDDAALALDTGPSYDFYVKPEASHLLLLSDSENGSEAETLVPDAGESGMARSAAPAAADAGDADGAGGDKPRLRLRQRQFFKEVPQFTQFPVVEPRRRLDHYGEVIDPAAWGRKPHAASGPSASGAGGAEPRTARQKDRTLQRRRKRAADGEGRNAGSDGSDGSDEDDVEAFEGEHDDASDSEGDSSNEEDLRLMGPRAATAARRRRHARRTGAEGTASAAAGKTALGADAETGADALADDADDDDALCTYEPYDFPLVLRCGIVYIDAEGLTDGSSVMTILSHLQPRHIVLVHGDVSAPPSPLRASPSIVGVDGDSGGGALTLVNSTDTMRALCAGIPQLAKVPVLAPEAGVQVHVNHAQRLVPLRLAPELAQQLRFARFGAHEITFLSALMTARSRTPAADGTSPMDLEPDERASTAAPTPTPTPRDPDLVLAPLAPLDPRRRRAAFLIGDLKLSQFRRQLRREGLQASFRPGGDLCVENTCVVAKDPQSGALRLRGPLSPVYYHVRRMIYEQHVLV